MEEHNVPPASSSLIGAIRLFETGLHPSKFALVL